LIAQITVTLSLIVGGILPPTNPNSEGSLLVRNLRAPEGAIVRPPVDAKCPQWWHLAVQEGWSRSLLAKLDKIMWRESRCNLYAINKDDPNKGSWGLMQVNGFWVKYLSSRGILERLTDLQDPSINLRSALAIYNYADARHDNGWGPWGEE
jgi:hypothetical protein